MSKLLQDNNWEEFAALYDVDHSISELQRVYNGLYIFLTAPPHTERLGLEGVETNRTEMR